MTEYTAAVLRRAEDRRRMEIAAMALSAARPDPRGWVAAAIAALAWLTPAISAAQSIIY